MKSKHTLTLLSVLLGLTLTAHADDPRIQSFDCTGKLTFYELSTATTYRVDWANSPTGVWHTGSPGVTGITARGYGTNAATVGLTTTSCFYRVVATVTNAPLYLVVDVSGGTNASSYPVSSMMSPPAGGWTDDYKTNKIVFRRIPAGTFTMGSPSGELGRNSDETQHQVTLSQDFYIGVFQVTQRQWELVMGNRPSHFTNSSYYATRPAETVSYNDIRGASAGANWPMDNNVAASSFMGVLRSKTGKTFDLPTESQWEYACRAGTATALNSGYNLTNTSQDVHMDAVGRYSYNGGAGGWTNPNCDTSAGTAKVGSYIPNAWGLYDMHGNVWEWCLDWYGTYPGAVNDPKGASSGLNRVFHGGSWGDAADHCRSAFRNDTYPAYASGSLGFRACILPPGPTSDYLVVDVSGGTTASSYPVNYLSAVPSGGWTDDYTTTKIIFRRIPAGTFTMGSPSDELGRYDDDNDETHHQVTLSQDFYIGVFQITQKQWERVMGNWPSWFTNAAYRDARPVEQVSYNDIRGASAGANWPGTNTVDASSFMGVLRTKTGKAFDLPTEAQWEYACRAGTMTALNSGYNFTDISQLDQNVYMDQVGRYLYNGGNGPRNVDTRVGTAKVGRYQPNKWGLYDMHGNVWQWCLDGCGTYPGSVIDPKGTASIYRVLRGGSWVIEAEFCRSASRRKRQQNENNFDYGFRTVLPSGQ